MLLAPPHKTTSAIFTHVSWHPYTMNWRPEPQSLLAVRAEVSLGTSTSNWHVLPSMQHLKNYLLGYFKEYSSRTKRRKHRTRSGRWVWSFHPLWAHTSPSTFTNLKLWLVFICERKSYKTMDFIFNSRIFVNQMQERIISFDAMGSLGRSFNLPLKTWQI